MAPRQPRRRTSPTQEKVCASCGRSFSWCKAWERDWEQIRYCSDACRRHRVTETDQALEEAVRGLLARTRTGGTICPSEAASLVGNDGWRELMEPARRAARRLVAAGEVEIVQGGRVVNPSTAKGPIRIRLVR